MASILYRVAGILLVLFAAGHQLGFRRVDPRWKADAVVESMKATRFDVQGFPRSYWDFFTGFGLFVTVLLLFAAVLAWQLGSAAAAGPGPLAVVRWAFAACFVVAAVTTWRYFFPAPGVLSTLVALCLVAAAWAAGRG